MNVKGLTRASLAIIVLAGVVSLLFIACASPGNASAPTAKPAPSSGGAAPSPPSIPASAAPAVIGGEIREIKVTMENKKFPKEIRLKAGTKVVFVITNRGTVKHTFEFPDLDVNKEIQAGETVNFEWTVPNRKGKWDMGCFLTEEGYHEGMEGILIIE